MKKYWAIFGSGLALIGGMLAFNLQMAPTARAEEQVEAFTTSTEQLDFGQIPEAGKSYSSKFTVTNHTDAVLVLKTAVVKYDDAKLKDDYKLASDWLVFIGGKTQYQIAANGTADVSLRAVVPTDAKANSQYAAVTITNQDGSETKTVRVKLSVAGDGLKYGGSVSDNHVDVVSLDGAIKAFAKVKNAGTAGFPVKYSVRISPAFGIENWQSLKDDTAELTPETEQTFELKSNYAYGVYKVEQKISYYNEAGKLVEVVLTRPVINCPLWGVIVAGALIVLIIMLIVVLKHHKNHKKSAKSTETEGDESDEKGKESDKDDEGGTDNDRNDDAIDSKSDDPEDDVDADNVVEESDIEKDSR